MRNSYFSEVLHSIKLRGVKFLAVSYWAESCRFSVSFYRDGHWDWLLAVWYCTESLYTAPSQQPFLNTFAQAFKGTVAQKYKWILILLLKGYNFYLCTNVLGLHFFLLCTVWYCAESVFFILNFEYLCENKTKFEIFLTHYSVAQAGLNEEKN